MQGLLHHDIVGVVCHITFPRINIEVNRVRRIGEIAHPIARGLLQDVRLHIDAVGRSVHLAGGGIEQLIGVAEIVVGISGGEGFGLTRTAVQIVLQRRRITIRPTTYPSYALFVCHDA
jgi:hypothetical protein